MFSKVKTKSDYYRRAKLLEFGNRFELFDTVEEALASKHTMFTLRAIGKPGQFCVPWVTRDKLRETFEVYLKKEDVSISIGAVPSVEARYIQGEIMQTPDGLYMFYSLDPKLSVRDALATSGKHMKGLGVLHTLKHYMTPSSWDDLEILLERYPDAVIEFTVYASCVGVLPGRNTIIWEVRNY